MNYYNKYIKYKNKYLKLNNMKGGGNITLLFGLGSDKLKDYDNDNMDIQKLKSIIQDFLIFINGGILTVKFCYYNLIINDKTFKFCVLDDIYIFFIDKIDISILDNNIFRIILNIDPFRNILVGDKLKLAAFIRSSNNIFPQDYQSLVQKYFTLDKIDLVIKCFLLNPRKILQLLFDQNLLLYILDIDDIFEYLISNISFSEQIINQIKVNLSMTVSSNPNSQKLLGKIQLLQTE